jgi:hypothetical protein
MNDFIKRALYFGLIYNIANAISDNFIIIKHQQSYSIKVAFDMFSILIIIGFFIFAFLLVAIIKLLSVKINQFIYESYTSITYIAFIAVTVDWVVNLLGISGESGNKILFYVLCYSTIFGQLILCTLVIYYFWKYRIEIGLGIFLGRILFTFDIADKIYLQILSIKPTDVKRFYLISIIVILFIALTIILRKLNVYDFRSRKDKWLEATGEGPYKVWAKSRCA